MCDYKSLVNSEWGYVVRCNSCSYYQVAFGNTVLRFSKPDFLSFVQEVKDKLNDSSHVCCRQSKSIYISTDLRNLSLVFTYHELEQFFTLLNKAADKLNKEILFNFCDN